MRNKIIILAALIFTASCDAPRDRRAAYKGNDSDDSPYWFSSDSSGGKAPDTTTERDEVDDTPTTPSTSTIPSEVSHCSWSSDGVSGFETTNNSHLGHHTLCQSSSNPDDIYIQVKTKIEGSQVCFIPNYSNSSASIYIGGPRCIMLDDNRKIYKITLYKNRAGYSGYAINSVMAMKDKLYFYPAPFNQNVLAPDAYIYCSQFLDQYNHAGYCDSFKSLGEYVYKKF
jgi:hypothetical protein